MSTPAEVVADWSVGNNDLTTALSRVEPLQLAESALIEGEVDLCEAITPQLSDAQNHFLRFRRAQLSNDMSAAQESLADCVTSSRERGVRDHTLEARARMEWGLLRFALGETEQAGVDLKWSMERLNALEEGSAAHGLSMLNMAAWHESIGEPIMALAIHSQISRHGPHLVETVSMSRLRAANISFNIGDLQSSMRHSWVAYQGLMQSDVVEMAQEAALLWLDIALNEVSDDAPTMQQRVQEASPRNLGDAKDARANPKDMALVLSWLLNTWDGEAAGEHRPDLAVMVEAEQLLGGNELRNQLTDATELVDHDVRGLLTGQD